jgi:hypothetical protein
MLCCKGYGVRGGVIGENSAFIRDSADPERSSAGEVEDERIGGEGKGDKGRREGE